MLLRCDPTHGLSDLDRAYTACPWSVIDKVAIEAQL